MWQVAMQQNLENRSRLGAFFRPTGLRRYWLSFFFAASIVVLIGLIWTATIARSRDALLGGPGSAQGNQNGSARRLIIPTEELELGEVWFQNALKHQVHVTNDSTEVVQVNFTASCDCTDVEPTQFTFAPGESVPVRLVLDLSTLQNRDEPTRDVPFHIELRATVANLRWQQSKWTLRGTALAAARADPRIVDFDELLEGAPLPPREIQVRLTDPGDQVTAAEVPNWLQCHLEQAAHDRSVVKAKLVPQTLPALGPLRDVMLRFRITSEGGASKGTLSVPVLGQVVNDISIEPLPLSFGILSPGTRAETEFTVSSRSKTAIEVLVQNVSPDIKVSPIESAVGDASHRCRFRLTYTAPMTQGPHDNVVDLLILNPQGQKTAVGVHVFSSVATASQSGNER
jgi:hypothetical protein